MQEYLNVRFMGGANHTIKHRYKTRGVVGGAYKLLYIVGLEMTFNE